MTGISNGRYVVVDTGALINLGGARLLDTLVTSGRRIVIPREVQLEVAGWLTPAGQYFRQWIADQRNLGRIDEPTFNHPVYTGSQAADRAIKDYLNENSAADILVLHENPKDWSTSLPELDNRPTPQTTIGFLSAEVLAGRISYKKAAFGDNPLGPFYGEGLATIMPARITLNADPAQPNIFGDNALSRSGQPNSTRRIEPALVNLNGPDGNTFATVYFPGSPSGTMTIRPANGGFSIPLADGSVFTITDLQVPTSSPIAFISEGAMAGTIVLPAQTVFALHEQSGLPAFPIAPASVVILSSAGTAQLASVETLSSIPGLPAETVLQFRDALGVGNRAPRCFLPGTPVLMADGTHKPIEQIRIGDLVLAFDPATQHGRGALAPSRVTRTFQNTTRTVLDLRGLRMTPGHVCLTAEGSFATIATILAADGTLVLADGTPIRARTGARLASPEDALLRVAYTDPASGAPCQVTLRAGIPCTARRDADGTLRRYTLADILAETGHTALPDGRMRDASGEVFDACDWPAGATPLDRADQRAWIVIGPDGTPYTPDWVQGLEEEAGQEMAIGATTRRITAGPGAARFQPRLVGGTIGAMPTLGSAIGRMH